MLSKKDSIFVLILTINLFLLSFFISRNLIDVTNSGFRSSRTYGFPLAVVSLSRNTQDYSQAKDVYSKSNYDLLNNGWEIKMASERGINFLAASSLNFISSLVVSFVLVGAYNVLVTSLIRRARGEYYEIK